MKLDTSINEFSKNNPQKFKKYFKIFSSLGAIHDGDPSATSCPAANNNIMTPVIGQNPNNLVNYFAKLFFFILSLNCCLRSKTDMH